MKKIILFTLLFLIPFSYIFSQQKYLPKQYISNALTYAQNHFDASATMYAITTATPVDSTGKSTTWLYWFYKPNVNDSGYAVTIIVVAGFPAATGLRTPNMPGSILRPLGTAFCESNLAVTAAENAGGAQFRQAHPGAIIIGSVYRIPGTPDTSKPYWTYIYNDSAASQSRVFMIDGITCTVIPIGIEPISNETPSSFSLNQNYPNPFNPSTIISFTITVKGLAVLKVFDPAGRELETLVNMELYPGVYRLNFDGSKYTSGVYLCQLSVYPSDRSEQSVGYTQAKKMVLIK